MHDYLLAYSCRTRYFCPSCRQKRVPLYGEWIEANVLAPVAHRQYVLTVPRLLRPMEDSYRCRRFPKGCSPRVFGARCSGFWPGRALFPRTCAPSSSAGAPAVSRRTVRVAGEEREGRKKLAGTMLRAPMSVEKMTYDGKTGSVIYRSKRHPGLKRNFQVNPRCIVQGARSKWPEAAASAEHGE